ncbi:MAG TPA: HAMP domain-containing protein [Labilithrix sp.]|nr:HAMP domain-containing protein [Labilithrix sp.]
MATYRAPPQAQARRHSDRRARWRLPFVDRSRNRDRERLRSLRDALRAAAHGDLSVRLSPGFAADVDDELVVEVADALDQLLSRHQTLVDQLCRLEQVVGVEGNTKARIELGAPTGSWAVAAAAVNSIIAKLAGPITETTSILASIAEGDLSREPLLHVSGVALQGDLRELGLVERRLVRCLRSVTENVSHLARQIGTEGTLGREASTEGLSGTWRTLVDDVNLLSLTLTAQVRNIALVSAAIANGDLSQKITVETRGEILELKNAINCTVDKLRSFAAEVTRVAREVGTEGKLGAQADVRDVSGVWQELTDNVNRLASNLTLQVRNIAQVATAIANGDLSQKITVEASGEILELKNTLNAMVDQLRRFAGEVTRVAREVGSEGRLGAVADVEGVSGTWRDLTDSVNMLAGNLTAQVRNIALVATAIANGDLSQKITVEAKGEIFELKNTVNSMVDRLLTFAAEVTRVAREVGTEGKLGGQADVKGVSGTWKDLTDSVNLMALNLTDQVRGIARVVTKVANGDLSQTFVVEAEGEIAALADTINNMTARLRTFADQVTTVAREVGIEGKLGGQARVPDVSGIWRDLTDNVNVLAGNLTNQVRNIALVTTAVAKGDLSQKITVEARGEILELKDTVNSMVDQLRTFGREVTRVAREVGTEGKLGGQAKVPGVAGTWQELTESVNVMASNLTSQVRGIAKVVTAVAGGDLGQKLVLEARGEIASLSDTINAMTDTLRTFADQVTTVAREVGIEGKLGGQARVPGAAGTWKDLTDNVNMLAGNLTAQVRNIALVTTAVADGDLSKKITVEARGEIQALKDTVNGMVDQLRTFASEVTRVAREVGIDGQLGGQATVPGVSGTWKDLTDNVNLMASNLTDQVRGIGMLVTSVARGDLTKKLVLVARGEIAALADTINAMTETLRTFADQVTTVAREVGIEGRLGGQAKVPGAAGTWRDLTDNVNQLAANLTSQVRAISEVAVAVTQGDLTRTIAVDARGEVLGLKDTINQMIANLRDTTKANKEQDWLKTNLAKFFSVMQGQRNLQSLTDQIMRELTPAVEAQHGAFYLGEVGDVERAFELTSSYAYRKRKGLSTRFALGDGLVGQCARERKPIIITDVPDDYIHVGSGLGEAAPRTIAVFPVLFEDQVRAVIELASFKEFSPIQLAFLEQLMLSIGLAINLIGTSMRTEQLLTQLQGSNAELDRRRKEIEDRASLLEARNCEIAQKSALIESKSEELARVSQYKSQFLTNMSHEIRTPLNSMMILAQMLASTDETNLTDKQREWAGTIHSAGRDLLSLINQILDLSKVEAGRIEIHSEECSLADLSAFVDRTFRPVALQRGLELNIVLAPTAPASIVTDRTLLEQILKNLVSNACKFTESGSVELCIDAVPMPRHVVGVVGDAARFASKAVAFAVEDTGIGIAAEQRERIFEAFQQGDASMTRKYGGTGLGLTISREYARLLGGEIRVSSASGKGSAFTLYLPLVPRLERAIVPEQGFDKVPTEVIGSSSPDDKVMLAGRTVLVAEDDTRNLYAVTALLERAGAKVIATSTGREAVDALTARAEEVDLALLDVMMPEMDGLEAARALRANAKTAGLLLIALTAKASASDREGCLAAGFDAYVVKPMDARQMVAVLAQGLRPRSRRASGSHDGERDA